MPVDSAGDAGGFEPQIDGLVEYPDDECVEERLRDLVDQAAPEQSIGDAAEQTGQMRLPPEDREAPAGSGDSANTALTSDVS